MRDKTITEQTFEQRSQAFRNAQASVSGNEAAVRQAELDLEFTELRAPIDGRIGDRRVSPGNLVTGGTGGNTTLLATIVSTDPIRFEFTFDEASYPALRAHRQGRQRCRQPRRRRAGRAQADRRARLRSRRPHGFRRQRDRPLDRHDPRPRAVFDNPNGVFTPGMFARVRVPASPPYEALLVPDAAIGTEQTRKYVLVVGADNNVAQKYVTLGQTTSDDLRVIKTGIGPDDRVIVNGLMRARAGPEGHAAGAGRRTAGSPAGAASRQK